MRVSEAINAADELRAGNKVPITAKRRWLKSLDDTVYANIISKHEGAENISAPADYTLEDCEMLIPDTHSEVYVWFLVSQIDAALGESERYNTSAERHNALYNAFSRWYTREHTPINNARLRNVSRVRGV